MAGSRQQTVGTFGFWLTVPIALSLLVAWLLRLFVSQKFSLFGMAALVYAMFTLYVIANNQNRFVRGALLLVNFSMVMVFGYYQWSEMMPSDWPVWSPWLGATAGALIWIVIFGAILYQLGNKSHGQEQTHENIAEAIQSGHITPSVTEQIISAIKLTSSKGDVTVNTAKLLEQLGLQSVTNDRTARASTAEAIRNAIKDGLVPQNLLQAAKSTVCDLLGIKDSQEEVGEEADAEQWEEPVHEGRAVF